jgi:hypothetical protein
MLPLCFSLQFLFLPVGVSGTAKTDLFQDLNLALGQFDFELNFWCPMEFDQDQASKLPCLKHLIPAKPWTDKGFGTVAMKEIIQK